MPKLEIRDTVETSESDIKVDFSRDYPLKVWAHLFQLVVLDNDGNESHAAKVEDIVRDDTNPTSVIRAIPAEVPYGESFILSGKDSSDIPPGVIKRHRWTRVS